MKYLKIIGTLVFVVFLQQMVTAQISYGGNPISNLQKTLNADIDHLQIRKPDIDLLLKEDRVNDKNGRIQRMGHMIDVDINMENSGTWDILSDGRRVWRLQISSTDALALGLYFDEFELPNGSQLFVYSPDRKQVLGSYNHKNNANGGAFAIELVYGESLILEYISPRQRIVSGYERDFVNTARFNINRLNYAYRQVFDPFRSRGFGDSDECEVNINCSEGNNWQDEKKGIARISIVDAFASYWCSGSLVNNTNQDGTPYFLSAWHCREDISEIYLDSWIFYFNYEFSGCENQDNPPFSHTITGASTKADAELNGGSDLLLMELNSTPPLSYGVVYNGWTRSSTPSGNGVGIHHPYGDVKKISTYTSSLSSATYYGGYGSNGASNAHWKVYWSETSNGYGVTEGGSSGSPLFNNDGLIVGTLSGGSATCETPSLPDLYGKISYHWTSNGSSAAEQLAPWLDPAGTGQIELDFYDPGNSEVEASFSASPTTVTAGAAVHFNSTSTGAVNSYYWSFPGASPATSNSMNPVVVYNTVGEYNVSLTVSGNDGSDTHTEYDFISVIPAGGGQDCVFLNDPLAGTATFYTTDSGSGYVSGTNSYEDIAKVNYFDHEGIGYVANMGFHVADAQGSSSNIRMIVYSVVDGVPGVLLGAQTIDMSNLSDAFEEAGDYFEFPFNTPVQVNGDFFAGIELPGEGDIFALITNTDGDSFSGTAWEQLEDGTWINYKDEASWDLSVDHALYPEVCETLGSKESVKLQNIHCFPNPTNSVVKIKSDVLLIKAEVKVYNALGVLVDQLSSERVNELIVDMSNLADGLYVLSINTNIGNFTERIQLVK